ncbi:hydroxyacylglutathione hydrolase [Ursidibacter arcticus]
MLKIIPIPALSDNYIWLIQHQNEVVIVDPSEAKKVLDYLAKNQLNPTAILLTHHHRDHTDGVPELLSHYPSLEVYGSSEVSELVTRLVEPEEHFSLWEYEVRVIESAGHTEKHISYLVGNRWLFCGDALFSGGCGRVFTGNYQAQFDTLQRFNALPDWVEVYAGHEYTQSNLKFAQAVMSDSCMLFEYQERADILRSHHKPTLPTTIGIEKQINPFLKAENVEKFIQLRQQKDNF